MLRKVEDSFTLLATRKLQRDILLHCGLQKWGVARENFLATCNATFAAPQVARKIAPCNSAISHYQVI